ncbi:hypothetical protein [Parapedobacter koreensis]|uniref:Uncharacterized protein n=1 Tax=Parapedobacter koreensis TaxID=332977 RepID=A0A1H7PXU6_9SPHI|nr:hypothetical protein [Parapedobacter koreensis]SEL40711.1 hypothetical protein SAMN05421740_10576 [Parapedobacter koreensis]
MGIANEIWEGFIKQYPQVKSGRLSLDEINRLMAKYMLQRNNEPLKDFDGLSPVQMQALISAPLGPESIVQLKAASNEETVASVPMLGLSDMLLGEIRKAGNLKLTAKGNLPVSVCTSLVQRGLIRWKYMDHVKKYTEDNVPYIWPLKDHLLVEGLVKKRDNKLSLTKNGEQYLTKPDSERLLHILTFFTLRFDWRNLYRLEDGGTCGNLGWAYSLYLLLKNGHKRLNTEFYFEKWMAAFEKERWEDVADPIYPAQIDWLRYTYNTRFFECFAVWFGLVKLHEIRVSGQIFNELEVEKSELMDKLFNISEKQKEGWGKST